MAEIIVQFNNLGREHFNEPVTFMDPGKESFSAEDIIALVHGEAARHLLSPHVLIEFNPGPGEGLIYAGFYPVGSFKLVKVQQFSLWKARE